MSVIRVGVLRGGPSQEYDVSLKTGSSVLRALSPEYKKHDILVDKTGKWHINGLPINPHQLHHHVDVIINAMHGEYGEDGQVQNILDQVGIHYTGSGQLASNLGLNKALTKEIFLTNGIKTPRGFVLESDLSATDAAKEIFLKIAPPWIIKPINGGSSIGLYLAKTYYQLVDFIDKARQFADRLLIEEYIRGREATCGVIENFRGAEYYALLPIEIVRPRGESVWNYQDKYSSETQKICPGRFTADEARQISELAVMVHKIIGARHYSHTDFIVSPRGIYTLEINTLPGMTEHSLLPKSLAAIGCQYSHFLDHLIKLALKKN